MSEISNTPKFPPGLEQLRQSAGANPELDRSVMSSEQVKVFGRMLHEAIEIEAIVREADTLRGMRRPDLAFGLIEAATKKDFYPCPRLLKVFECAIKLAEECGQRQALADLWHRGRLIANHPALDGRSERYTFFLENQASEKGIASLSFFQECFARPVAERCIKDSAVRNLRIGYANHLLGHGLIDAAEEQLLQVLRHIPKKGTEPRQYDQIELVAAVRFAQVQLHKPGADGEFVQNLLREPLLQLSAAVKQNFQKKLVLPLAQGFDIMVQVCQQAEKLEWKQRLSDLTSQTVQSGKADLHLMYVLRDRMIAVRFFCGDLDSLIKDLDETKEDNSPADQSKHPSCVYLSALFKRSNYLLHLYTEAGGQFNLPTVFNPQAALPLAQIGKFLKDNDLEVPAFDMLARDLMARGSKYISHKQFLEIFYNEISETYEKLQRGLDTLLATKLLPDVRLNLLTLQLGMHEATGDISARELTEKAIQRLKKDQNRE